MKKPVKFISTFLICAVVVCLLSVAVFAGALYWQLSGICGTLELDGLEKPSGDVINVLALGVDGGEAAHGYNSFRIYEYKDQSGIVAVHSAGYAGAV